MTPDQKKNLLIGGGVGVAALLGVLLFGRRQAAAAPVGPAAPQPLQMPAQSFQMPAQFFQLPVRPYFEQKRRNRRRRDDDDRGDRRRDDDRDGRRVRGENGRGEYGRKHRRRHGDE